MNLAQTQVIVEALDALPKGLGEDLLAKAELLLVQEAATLGPRELKVFGSRLLDYLAPDIADDIEYQRLLADERRARAATRCSIRPAATGPPTSTPASATTPPADSGPTSTPTPPPGAATVTVTLDHDTLVSGIGVATTSTGDRITAGTARRLACQAGIIPVVLGGDSEILDVGRTERLVTDAIRKALNLRDKGCTTIGCSMPAEFCEADHVVPWSRGGKTSLHACKLLCPFHHHRAHDPAWLTHHHPNGKTTFTRRT